MEGLRTERTQETFADSKLAGFAVRVSGATGSKVFVHRYTVDGARKVTTIGRHPRWSVKDARARAAEIAAEAHDGTDLAADAKQVTGTLGEFWPRFMESKTLSASTLATYTSLWEAHLKGPWASKQMRHIKRAEVAKLLGRKRHQPTTHNRVRSLIVNLWNTAEGQGFGGVENNPARRYPKMDRTPRRRAFDRAELALLWKGFDSAPLVIGGVFKVCLLTAQRQGQVRKMRWEDIEGPTWKCPAEFTKGKRAQWIPLSDAVLEVLETLRGLDDVWVFPALRDDSATGHIGGLSSQFKALAEAEGLEDARGHDLRTTFGTFCLQPLNPADPALPSGLGIPLAVVSECLSHKPDALAFDRYAHPDARSSHLIAERREALATWAVFALA